MATGDYKSKIGLDSLYIAAISEDSATAYTAGTPQWLAPAAAASQEPTTNVLTQYADDQPYDVMTSEGETKITLEITGIDLQTLALIDGSVFNAATGEIWDNNGIPGYFALLFRSLKSNGSYRYYAFMKGMFTKPKEEAVTRGESPEPKTITLEYTAIKTVYQWNLGSSTDSIKRIIGDDDTLNFDETGWFTAVRTPAYSAPSALALSSSVPTDGATGIAIAANQTLTFNNALQANAELGAVLVNQSTGALVASTNSIDAALKVITINPDSNLTVDVPYIITYSVTDIYGDQLSGAINFTCVSA